MFPVVPPFPTHDLLADFSELRSRLLLVLEDGRKQSKATLVDAFLLACGLNQVLEDYMSDGGSTLTTAARVVAKSAPGPLTGLARPLSGGAGLFQQHRDGGHLRDCQRELAAVVAGLADDLARTRGDADAIPRTSRLSVARCIERLGHLSVDVQARVIRLPACFRSLDQDPEDFARLVDRFCELHADRGHPVLIVGLRSSGSYTAPLCAAYLRVAGYQRVDTITVRPRQRWLPGEVERIKAAADAAATVVLTDDPPNTGGSLVDVARELEALSVEPGRLVIAVPLMGDQLPRSLAGYQRVTLAAHEWAIQDRLADDAVRESLGRLLAGRAIEAGAGAVVRVASVRCVTRLYLPPMTDLKSGSPSRRHVRALFMAELVDDAGLVHEHSVYVKGTGLGYMGDHSLAIGGPLQEFFPAIYGVQDGLMFRAWMPDSWSLADGAGPTPRDLTRRMAGYVLARREALATDRDIAERLAGEGPLWKQTSQVLLSLFGTLRLGALSIADHAAKRLLHAARPSVIDGSMALTQWFAKPGAGAGGIRKVDFDERAFSNQDFIIDQLYCYDAVYDLASAAADYDAWAADRDEDDGFVDSLKSEYERASNSHVDQERWFLYQLMHTITNQRFIADLHSAEQAGDRLKMVLKFAAGQRAMSRAAQRYYRARFFCDLPTSTHGPLCAIDIDGVLESDQMGFPATSPAGALALRSLTAHGYRPVLASGRSLAEVRERCRAYCLAGGVAEYGAAVYKRDGDRIIHMAASDADGRLKALRDVLAGDPWVHIDPSYRAVVRAYRFDAHGRRRHLELDALQSLAPELGRLRLRRVDGAYQTDFVPEEVDKGKGIRRLQDELGDGAPAPLSLAVGDGLSDLPVFALAATACAPANAHDAVRSASRKMSNLRVLRGRAQAGLYLAAKSVIGHSPGKCGTCAPPRVNADGRLLLTMLSAQDGRKLHKVRMAVSAAIQLAHPEPARDGAEGDSAIVAIGQAAGRRLIKGEGLVGSSGLLFSGNLVARAVGLLFVVAAARFLTPTNYGFLAYALVIVNFGTALITNAPAGLSGFLSRNAGNRDEQDKYFTNWVLVVATMLSISVVAIVPLGLVAGLRGWMIPALMANLLGIAVFETYRASQRGLANFRSMTGFYILANLMQLVAILVAGFAGFRDAALFVTIYGLTNVAALLALELMAPTPLRFVFRSVQWDLVRRIALLSWPLLLQTALFAVWFGSDLILVRTFLAAPLAGDYAAAKTLVNLVALPAGAIGSAVVPRIAGLSGPPFRRDVGRALGLAAAVVVPSLLVLIALGGPIVRLIFGAKYSHSVEPLPLLGVGVGAYAFYVILESVWVGLGRPAIDAVATGAGMLVTLSVGLLAVPRAGLAGAAAAFAIGAAVQLATIGLFTVVAYARASHAGRPLGRSASLEAKAAVSSGVA
jgi:O-antigen/teichoic acid export membrane protein/hydroxymethylpyrimidine pyrophosphatase-like HAD family hydrolase